MASRPEDPSSRHVGRIVDPMVRDDGELEPELSIEPTALPALHPESAPAVSDSGAQEPARGGAMRARLLERAARAEPHSHTQERKDSGDDLDDIGKHLGDERPLGDAPRGAARAPGSPLTPARSSLSPTVMALFGTLMGMAVIASVTAIAMHIAPHRATLLDTPSATPTLETTPLVAPEPQKRAKKRERQRLPGPWRVSEGAHTPGLKLVEGKVGTDAFLKAVQAAGVPLKETYRIVTAFQGLRSFDRCGKNDRFAALLDSKTERLKAFEYQVSGEEVYQAREGQSGLLEASKLDLKVERTQVAGSLVYDGKSLDDSAEQAGFERGLARVVTRALDGHSAIEDLERGDIIRLIVQEVSVLGEFDRYAGVEALEVKPAKGDAIRIYYYDAPNLRGYYDAKGRSPHQGGWRKPVPGAPITSHFNLKRMHPILKKVTPHLGTDFGAPTGTPVYATAPGTVTFVGARGPAGNLVKLEHAGGIETGYAHCSRFAEGLKAGDKVKRLQLIAYVGSTGRSTGPHLHFSASKNGEFFDAEKLDLDGMRTLAGSERIAFDAVMAKYNPLLDAIVLPEPLPPEEPVAAAPRDSAARSEPAAPSASGAAARELEAEEDDTAAPPPPLPAPPPSGSPTRAAASIYLTDQELRALQNATDEVGD
ncbi:MAG TPA: M23 family metallopeptidase [Polyangiaceae bacterium]|nr:M23 family metallopeptidase [Polyangiaceae bacterium]